MKKFRGFTLIESLFVIIIIGIISTAIFNMRNVGKDYNDYRKEAVNIIYKEINQSLKDLQRNKVWKDPQGYTHKISSFQISFVSEQAKEKRKNNNTVNDTTKEFTVDGKQYKLENGVLYIYEQNNRVVVEKFYDDNEGRYQFYQFCDEHGVKRTDGYDIKDKGLDTSATYIKEPYTLKLKLAKNDNGSKIYELIQYGGGDRDIIQDIEKIDEEGLRFAEFCSSNGIKRTDGYDIKDKGLDTSTTYRDGGTKTFHLELIKNDNFTKQYEFVIYHEGNRDVIEKFTDIDEAGRKFTNFCNDKGFKRTDGYEIKDKGLDTNAIYTDGGAQSFMLELVKNDGLTKIYEFVHYPQIDAIKEFYDENKGGIKFADFCNSNGIKRTDGYDIKDKGLDTNAIYTDGKRTYQLENIDNSRTKKKANTIERNYALVYYEGDRNTNEGQYQKVDDQKYKVDDNELRLQGTYGWTPVAKIGTNPTPVTTPKPNFLINKRYGKDLEIGNIYLYCMDSAGTIIECSSSEGFNSDVRSGAGYYDYVQLIKDRNYTSSKKIKNIDDFEFILSGGYDVEAINLLPDGKISEGDYISGFKESIYNMNYASTITQGSTPTTNDALKNYCSDARNECKQYANAVLDPSCTPHDKMCCRPHITLGFNGGGCNNYNSACCPVNDREESSLLAELRCLNNKRYYTLNCDEILAAADYIDDDNTLSNENIRKSYTFTVYAYYKKDKPKCSSNNQKQRQPVGQITINTITKTASMARCNNDQVTNGIDCGGPLCQN